MTENKRPSSRDILHAHDIVIEKYGHLFGYQNGEEDKSPYRPRWLTPIRMMRSIHAVSSLLIVEKTPEGPNPYTIRLDPTLAHLFGKFPDPRTCPRWYGKSEGWWCGKFDPTREANVCVVRFTTFEAWDAVINWLRTLPTPMMVSPHTRHAKSGIALAYGYEIRIYLIKNPPDIETAQ